MADDVRRRDSLRDTKIEVTKPDGEERRKCCLLTGKKKKKKKKKVRVSIILFERSCLLFYSFPIPTFPGFLHSHNSPHKHP